MPESVTPVTPITAFSQRDPRWAGERLGAGPLSLGQAGCLVTAMASVLADVAGVSTGPGRLNGWLRDNGGFASGDLFVFRAVEGLGLRMVDWTACPDAPAPVEAIADGLAAGFGVVAKVDFWPGERIQQHWVRVLAASQSMEPERWQIMDPWQAPGHEVQSLSKYAAPGWDAARALFAVAIYAPMPGRRFEVRGLADTELAQDELCWRTGVR